MYRQCLWESTAPAGALVANTRPAAATTASANLPMIFMASPKQTPIFHCSSHQDHRPNLRSRLCRVSSLRRGARQRADLAELADWVEDSARQHRRHARTATSHSLRRWISPASRSTKAISTRSCTNKANQAGDQGSPTNSDDDDHLGGPSGCRVATPPVVRRWLSLGLITEPPWTLQQLHHVRDETDPQGRRRGPQVAHGTDPLAGRVQLRRMP